MEKTKGEILREKLFTNDKNAYKKLSDEEITAAYSFCEKYADFLNNGKTERLVVKESIKIAEAAGFALFSPDKKYNAGDKIYINNREKSAVFAVIGKEPLEKGVRIAASHIDSPRIDLKPNPVYEDSELCFLKTQYYGGIKKYQWTAIPLALKGVVIKTDGTAVDISIGFNEVDPKFMITDLLPHLAVEQAKRTLSEGIKGEELNVLIGSCPFKDDNPCDGVKASDLVKLNILNILYEKYDITEADFRSAELSLVPAYPACDIGLDRSMIGSYGHDDRVCAYPSLIAATEADDPQYTVICVLADKEETGSDGNTGMNSAFFIDFIKDLAASESTPVRKILQNSKCLSADVNAAFDPTFPDPTERRNVAYINKGVVLTKYTGSRGKSDTSDASAEYVGFVRKMLDDNNIVWQTGELGKVDLGGGGTVAKYIAQHNIDTVDIGVPVLSMHAPMEVVSKLDVYMTYRAVKAFFM